MHRPGQATVPTKTSVWGMCRSSCVTSYVVETTIARYSIAQREAAAVKFAAFRTSLDRAIILYSSCLPMTYGWHYGWHTDGKRSAMERHSPRMDCNSQCCNNPPDSYSQRERVHSCLRPAELGPGDIQMASQNEV